MLYRPNFCCNCGEKIEKADWPLWASRRFCDLCATDHKGTDIAPKILIGAAIIFGIAGLFSYLRQPPATGGASRPKPFTATFQHKESIPAAPNLDATPMSPAQSQTGPDPQISERPASPVPSGRTREPVYYCGAMTKKGTPCSRRVKKGERCWQHAGLPAMFEVRGRDIAK